MEAALVLKVNPLTGESGRGSEPTVDALHPAAPTEVLNMGLSTSCAELRSSHLLEQQPC